MTRSVAIPELIVPTTTSGNRAETIVAQYLQQQGYHIVDRNWKLHKDCEIDIIAQKGGVMHMVEVKYRVSHNAGSGFDYITATKLKQMRYAANRWASLHAWKGEYVLSAAEVSGVNFEVTDYIAEVE